MKKILIGVVIALLIIMAYFAIFRGISIGNLSILSVQQIIDENDNLTAKIKETESLMKKDYQAKSDELRNNIEVLMNAKQEYYDLADISTSSEIQQANKVEEYTVEFLMTNLGRHATKQGVNLTYVPTSGTTGDASISNINFTVEGAYIAVINFVTALEDDSKLGFRIRNFKLEPNGEYLKATFLITNVKIKQESASKPREQTAEYTPEGSKAQNNSTTGTNSSNNANSNNGTNNINNTNSTNSTGNTNNTNNSANGNNTNGTNSGNSTNTNNTNTANGNNTNSAGSANTIP